MSVSGLGLNQNLFSGIDSVNAQQISGEIFSRAAQKTIDLSKTDLSQFRRPELGVDLYNSKTSLELQRQIAITQSGINTQNINTSYLNSQAASALYGGNNIAKTVDGKLFVPANSEVEPINTVEPQSQRVDLYQIANLNKDAKGSNPFAYKPQEESKKEDREPLNIFA
ncbi:TPA: hypothetical protein IAA86_00925 [Candidatus Galligastranaerophilus intestinavium]|uniref:Uncharacterized protein n=1 Tax=Candidatus Galligastranaerophilus intestinavium TaxID=2840836 RepID=A0A9D1FH38_9BACT|nr:hypothetical protein [Candidatus Galligastranaerophilus intestinavium]